jgi:hypothetical protein
MAAAKAAVPNQKGIVVGGYLKCVASYAVIADSAITSDGRFDLSPILLHWNGTNWVEVDKSVICNNRSDIPASLFQTACDTS